MDSDGSLRATLVEVSNEKDQVPEVGGVIGSVDSVGRTFTLGPLTIAWTNQTGFKRPFRPASRRKD